MTFDLDEADVGRIIAWTYSHEAAELRKKIQDQMGESRKGSKPFYNLEKPEKKSIGISKDERVFVFRDRCNKCVNPDMGLGGACLGCRENDYKNLIREEAIWDGRLGIMHLGVGRRAILSGNVRSAAR
jgi:hypothetical protein